ncbi:MAG: IS110 family transposase [Chloroflexaceae bacterium]
MDVVQTHVAGLDVHTKTVVVCCRTPDLTGQPQQQTRTFTTMTGDLLALVDWLTQMNITHVAMESTGEFWKPISNLLEPSFTVLVVNAQHSKNVPGRKTDVTDAQWIAQLLPHGLLRGSFIPPVPQRDLRDLTRQRTTLVRERAAVVNRLQNVLAWANLKLAGVASNVVGVSARAMLEAIVDGETDATVLANLAQRRLRQKQADLERALEGRVRDHHRFLIAEHLAHLGYLDDAIARYDQRIATYLADAPSAAGSGTGASAVSTEPAVPDASPTPGDSADSQEPPHSGGMDGTAAITRETAVALLDTIPGVARTTAEVILAEIGTDMTRFPSAGHLARWARVCPGNHESAGNRQHGATGHGNTWLKSALVQAAHAAVRVKDRYLAAVYRRLVVRRGRKKAMMAVAHRMVIAIYHMRSKGEPYRDQGVTALDADRRERLVHRLRHRIETLGSTVNVEPGATMTSG